MWCLVKKLFRNLPRNTSLRFNESSISPHLDYADIVYDKPNILETINRELELESGHGSKSLRTSHQRCSVGKGVLRIFAKFIGKQACNFIKKETQAQIFSCEFFEISKNTFFIEHLWATASEAYIFFQSYEKCLCYYQNYLSNTINSPCRTN